MAKKVKRIEATDVDHVATPPAPNARWSKRFLATRGAWKEEIELPRQTPVTELKDPFE